MPYEETGKEKAKREAYYKANRERGIRQEAERDYKLFGTTQQNIPQVNPMGDATMPAAAGMKKGGKVLAKEGGMLKPVDKEENPGLAKLPTPVRNKMGYMKKGGQTKKMSKGGSASSRADGIAQQGKTRGKYC